MNHLLRIGVTGGFGLIGKALRSKLQEQVVLVTRTLHVEPLNSNEEGLVGNFSDPLIIEKFVPNLNVLIHLATGVGPRSEFDEQYVKDDLIGTLNLIKAFFKFNPTGHFIYVSTAGGLYDLEDSNEKTEESEVVPKSLYGATKLLVEDFLENMNGALGLITILRPAAVYGDLFKKNQDFGLIDKLLKSISKEFKNSTVEIFDNTESSRDYIFVDDLVNAIKLLMKRNSNKSYEIYNVGSGVETSIADLIKIINDVTKENVNVKILPSANKRTSLIVNSDKIFKDIGWKAEVSLRDGILKMYKDLKKEL